MRALLPLLLLTACAGGDDPIESWTLASETIDETYVVSVWGPEDFDPDHAGYAVLYALDGDDGAAMRTLAAELQAAVDAGDAPEALLVGVGYEGRTGRVRDYTPTAAGPDDSGGSEAFLAFLVDEVVSEVEAALPTRTDRDGRALTGHSLGGLATCSALLDHHDTFGGFLAASPALSWDGQVIFEAEAAYAAQADDLPARLVLTAGELESYGPLPTTDAFADVLEERDWPGLDLTFEVVEGQAHMASRDDSWRLGLPRLFPEEAR